MNEPYELVLVPGRLYQPSWMFADRPWRLRYKAINTDGHSRPTRRHFSKLEKSARDKHSSLLSPFVSYEENKVLGI